MRLNSRPGREQPLGATGAEGDSFFREELQLHASGFSAHRVGPTHTLLGAVLYLRQLIIDVNSY